MSGFKSFLLRGNLIDMAVAFIIGGAFATVVSTFTAWVMSMIPSVKETFDPGTLSGAFLNSLITFVIVAAVVYFFVVTPYTKAKARFFPDPEPAPAGPSSEELLAEIRDLLAKR